MHVAVLVDVDDVGVVQLGGRRSQSCGISSTAKISRHDLLPRVVPPSKLDPGPFEVQPVG